MLPCDRYPTSHALTPGRCRSSVGRGRVLSPSPSVAASDASVTRRPRLLFLSQTLPYPPDAGVKIRTYHVLRLLASAFETTALCFYRWKGGRAHQDVPAAVRALSRLAQVEAFPIPQEHHPWRLVWDHLRSGLRGRVYTVFAYESPSFRSRLQTLLREAAFDLVHVDSLDLSAYLPLAANLPVACVHHDVESALLRRRAQHEAAWWRRAYVDHQATLMEREERYWCERVAVNVTVSDLDRATLEGLAPRGRLDMVPKPGRDDLLLRSDPAVGARSRRPHLDAVGRPGLGGRTSPLSPRLWDRADGLRPGCAAVRERRGLLRGPAAHRRWDPDQDPRCLGDGQGRGKHVDRMRGSRRHRRREHSGARHAGSVRRRRLRSAPRPRATEQAWPGRASDGGADLQLGRHW